MRAALGASCVSPCLMGGLSHVLFQWMFRVWRLRNRPDVSAVVEYFRPASIAAIQFIGTDAKVTFKREVHKQNAMQHKSISVNGVDCEIRGGGASSPKMS